jgi:hypothetical protein
LTDALANRAKAASVSQVHTKNTKVREAHKGALGAPLIPSAQRALLARRRAPFVSFASFVFV